MFGLGLRRLRGDGGDGSYILEVIDPSFVGSYILEVIDPGSYILEVIDPGSYILEVIDPSFVSDGGLVASRCGGKEGAP